MQMPKHMPQSDRLPPLAKSATADRPAWQVGSMAFRSRRLEDLLGGPLDAVTAAQIRGLVDNRVQERFDLEFKQQHYGASDANKRDLAIDVAAMANTAGGLIVLGVGQDELGTAIDTPDVSLEESNLLPIRQIVASGVSPLPELDVHAVPDAADGRGFVDETLPQP
jgi:hypothetical protein